MNAFDYSYRLGCLYGSMQLVEHAMVDDPMRAQRILRAAIAEHAEWLRQQNADLEARIRANPVLTPGATA